MPTSNDTDVTHKIMGLDPGEQYTLEIHKDGVMIFKDFIATSKYCPYSRLPGPEVIKLFSCSTQLSMKFHLLIKTKIPKQGRKILKIPTRPTSPYVVVNSIIYIGNSQNFYSSCSLRHLPWQADKCIFPALRKVKKFLALSHSDIEFILLINVKMSTIVDILTFMSRIDFVLS